MRRGSGPSVRPRPAPSVYGPNLEEAIRANHSASFAQARKGPPVMVGPGDMTVPPIFSHFAELLGPITSYGQPRQLDWCDPVGYE